MRVFTVNENDAGQRLDKFISKLMPKLPQSMLYKGLRKNCVRINGKHIKDGGAKLAYGDEVTLYFKDEFFEIGTVFEYTPYKLDIVYEDKNILVINKGVGVVCHGNVRGSGGALVDMVKSYLFDSGEYLPLDEHTFSPALCNRLDRNTGGLVIAAKNAEALRRMNEHIRNREVRKVYFAVAEGEPPECGELTGHAERIGNITEIKSRKEDGTKEVSLSYRDIARKDGYSLVRIDLHTGRTHQIRAQFSAAGYPLAGDTKYGGHGKKFRQALWSVELGFSFGGEDDFFSDIDGMKLRIKAPFEKYFE